MSHGLGCTYHSIPPTSYGDLRFAVKAFTPLGAHLLDPSGFNSGTWYVLQFSVQYCVLGITLFVAPPTPSWLLLLSGSSNIRPAAPNLCSAAPTENLPAQLPSRQHIELTSTTVMNSCISLWLLRLILFFQEGRVRILTSSSSGHLMERRIERGSQYSIPAGLPADDVGRGRHVSPTAYTVSALSCVRSYYPAHGAAVATRVHTSNIRGLRLNEFWGGFRSRRRTTTTKFKI